MHSLRQLLSGFRSRPITHLAVAFVAVSNHLTFVALAATPAMLVAVPSAAHSVCGPDAACEVRVQDAAQNANVVLPDGATECRDSGPAAACASEATLSNSFAGSASAPAGLTMCPATAGKLVPATAATCSETTLAGVAPAGTAAADPSAPLVAPSVPVASLGARNADHLSLTTDADTIATGKPALITATANATVTGSDLAIEIFDVTANTLIAACGQGGQCSVSYAATSGNHEFAAFLTAPTTTIPDSSVALPSNRASVAWLSSSITASSTIVGQGQPVTIRVTSSVDVRTSGRWLEIYDLTTGARVTYCSRGTTCTTQLKQTSGGVHELVGYVNGAPEAVSDPVYVTWLTVSLSATSIGPKTGGTVYLKATTNADLSTTPWVVGVYDQQGRLVDHACKTGTTCSVRAWMSGGTTPQYTAAIGSLPTSTQSGVLGGAAKTAAPPAQLPLVDVQAKSAVVEPTHLLWGVDSCKAFTGDPSGQELYSSVVSHLGTPEFWGRYLTNTVCPGISASEVALAARQHLGILPIYNEYDCSAVSSYATGHSYAVSAVAAARNLGIPRGRVLAVDIEPPGDACPGAAYIDSGFIDGWYEGVRDAGYVPVFYGNGTQGSEFASAWCTAVAAVPTIGTGSDLWTFQPSLLGSFNKTAAPNYSPYDPGCGGNMLAWQYVLSAGGNPDVDQDEVLSSLALWYPS